MKKLQRRQPSGVISFRPNPEVREMLDLASEATGFSVTEIINLSVLHCGDGVVAEIKQRQVDALSRFKVATVKAVKSSGEESLLKASVKKAKQNAEKGSDA